MIYEIIGKIIKRDKMKLFEKTIPMVSKFLSGNSNENRKGICLWTTAKQRLPKIHILLRHASLNASSTEKVKQYRLALRQWHSDQYSTISTQVISHESES